jgi:hypothetical protein
MGVEKMMMPEEPKSQKILVQGRRQLSEPERLWKMGLLHRLPR